jgi:hypothetical protein
MTHEELLAKLWILPADVTELQHGAKAVQALRVVVELHKPNDGEIKYCLGCSNSEFLMYKDCPTIQAIEKELND